MLKLSNLSLDVCVHYVLSLQQGIQLYMLYNKPFFCLCSTVKEMVKVRES